MSGYQDGRDRHGHPPVSPGKGASSPTASAPGKRTLVEGLTPAGRAPARGGEATEATMHAAAAAGIATPASPLPFVETIQHAVQRKEAKDDPEILANQARLKGPDVEIPAIEGALLATRQEAVKQASCPKRRSTRASRCRRR
jgi:hypothetical protein